MHSVSSFFLNILQNVSNQECKRVWPSYDSPEKGAHNFCVGGKERCSSFAAGLDHDAAPLQYTIAFLSALDLVFDLQGRVGLHGAAD